MFVFGKREMSGQLPEKTKPQFWPSFIFSIILFALGVATAWVGWDAIGHQHYEMNWKSRGTFSASSGILTLEGTAAIRFGAGLMSFGIMMAIWSVAIIIWFAQKYSPSFVTKILIALKWFSFVCLLVAMTCIFPMWMFSSISFWIVVVLVLVFAFALPNDTRKSRSSGFFIGLIGATIVCNSINVGTGARMAIGIFTALAILVHLFLLFPTLQKKYFLKTTLPKQFFFSSPGNK